MHSVLSFRCEKRFPGSNTSAHSPSHQLQYKNLEDAQHNDSPIDSRDSFLGQYYTVRR